MSLFGARVDQISPNQELTVMYNNLCSSASNVVMAHSATLFMLLILIKICFVCKELILLDLVYTLRLIANPFSG